jgi:hypothetical protein
MIQYDICLTKSTFGKGGAKSIVGKGGAKSIVGKDGLLCVDNYLIIIFKINIQYNDF